MDAEAQTTVVLIHGLWMTPRSWEDWAARYEEAGHRVPAPAWPGLEVESRNRAATRLRSPSST
jgi:pimeloyl-ACP methyl ester carboxylesterase